MSPTGPELPALQKAAGVVLSGGLLIYPTDTLYGLAADPRRATAVAKVFALKGRSAGKALPLAAADLTQAEAAGIFSPLARALAMHFWPGPLTLVVAVSDRLAEGVDGGTKSVALRVPDHIVARALAAIVGFPVVSTSANRAGLHPSRLAEEAMAGLAGAPVEAVLDAGPTPGGPPSTIVDARFDEPALIRAGAVPFERVLEAVARR